MPKPALPPKTFFTERQWLHKAYPGYPLLISLQALGAITGGLQRYSFLKEWFGGFYIEGTLWDWIWNVKGLTKTREYLLAQGAGFVQKLFEQHTDAFNTLWEKIIKIESLDLATLSPEDRVHHFTELVELMKAQASIGYIADCSLTTGADDWLATLITKECEPDSIPILTAPVFVSMQSQAHASLQAIAAVPEKDREKLIEEHTKNWHWVNNNYEEMSKPTGNVILNLIQDPGFLDSGSEAGMTTDDAKRAKEIFYKQHGVSAELQKAIRIAELLSEMQDKRKACVQRTNPLLWSMSEIVAREFNIDHALFMRLSALEFLDVLAGKKPDTTELKRRTLRALYWYPREGEIIWSGPELGNFQWELTFGQTDITELRGVPACAGAATGIARVIMTTQDLRDFQQGEIMVANQTTPEYTPYMRKAAAIVTDQGGLTAHAAVFSREFQIPCVIGCGTATKWIKNGDHVEVDAKKGIVKKL
ncbi:MAG: PEP-utilizing enzyme [bacterium]|nr:PEP-utilizing enzyme [bacterium]